MSMNLIKPPTVSENNWEIFIAVIYGYRLGQKIADQHGLTKSRIGAIKRSVTKKVLATGQDIPTFPEWMPTWRATESIRSFVERLSAEYPGDYDHLMRCAVEALARELGEGL